jgi:hypothetical protein
MQVNIGLRIGFIYLKLRDMIDRDRLDLLIILIDQADYFSPGIGEMLSTGRQTGKLNIIIYFW